ncbi:MAG: AAA family ATPase [Bdellovibrionaceae bacterium]|nr:AAA family ATPase [Pseudobdellovibrionaceae bacterium]
MKELAADLLYHPCDPDQLGFKTTREVEPFAGLLGQPRAVAAVELGIGIANHGYNVFAFGTPGTGKHKALERFLEAAALERAVPDDLCYVNNFDDAQKPRLLRLPGGRARKFQKDVQALIEELGTVLGGAFESDQYQTRRQVIEESFEERQSKALSELNEQARAQGITLLRTPLGIVFAPIRGDDVLSPEEFQKLAEDERARLKKQIEQFQAELQKILHQLPAWQREKRNLIQQLNLEVSTTAVSPLVAELREGYADVADAITHLEVVEKDILQNAQAFVTQGSGGQPQDALQLLAGGRGIEKPF